MQERNAQMALRLHQMTGEPLAHCSYLLDQTKGDYETALKILERILEQRKQAVQPPEAGTEGTDDTVDTPNTAGVPATRQTPPSLEQRVEQLEMQLAYLTGVLTTMSGQLSDLLGKLTDSGPASPEE
ncbi:hypothetical protein RY831_21070 [Noviherbaspirillum sp. CPCC 100848]|uniref:Uncharacterized protein n=1 Tax=Noviherbaspirillum album TaxID=3080276 RepID=A0ABU6JF06_9BURK|nr:hypothetical protein [Noviherbaspirillum sp. CPCC 100848]MEC4721664.1 hypothetical protein [Noviherbaspirillum sp. CPCC 100848]